MSTPMRHLPEHLTIGVTVDGEGPVDSSDASFHHWECWCGDKTCGVGRE